jgi:hypothetical protein
MDAPPLTINYELTEADLKRFFRHQLWGTPRKRLLWFVGLPGGLAVLTLAQWLWGLHRGESAADAWTALLIPTLALAVTLPVIFVMLPGRLARLGARSPGTLGPLSVEVSAARLVSRTPHGETVREWPSIHEIVETPDLLLFYVSTSQAILVPRRVFHSPVAAQSFLGVARAYRAAAADHPGAAVAEPLPLPEGGFEVTYSLTEDDIRAFQRYHLLHGRRVLVTVLGASVFFGACGAVISGPGAGVLGLIAAAGAFVWFLPWTVRRQLIRTPGVLGTQSGWVSPEGMYGSRAGLGSGLTAWTAVCDLALARDHLFIYWAPQNAIILPLRAFGSADEAEAAIRKMRDWHAAATAKMR